MTTKTSEELKYIIYIVAKHSVAPEEKGDVPKECLTMKGDNSINWEGEVFLGDEVDLTLGNILLDIGCELLLYLDLPSTQLTTDFSREVIAVCEDSYDIHIKAYEAGGVIHVDGLFHEDSKHKRRDSEWLNHSYKDLRDVIEESGALHYVIIVSGFPEISTLENDYEQ